MDGEQEGEGDSNLSNRQAAIKNFYSQISKADIRRLAELFAVDLELFDYDPQPIIDMGYGE